MYSAGVPEHIGTRRFVLIMFWQVHYLTQFQSWGADYVPQLVKFIDLPVCLLDKLFKRALVISLELLTLWYYRESLYGRKFLSKGQVISKGLVGILSSSKKWMKKYDNVDLFSFRFSEELKTPKSPFEINSPLNRQQAQ